MDKKILSAAGFFGMTAIVLGAFGAHALKKVLSMDTHISDKTKKIILTLTILGVMFFSGSIYLLATDSLNTFDFKVIGFVTPIGGLLLIVAWGILMLHFLKKKS